MEKKSQVAGQNLPEKEIQFKINSESSGTNKKKMKAENINEVKDFVSMQNAWSSFAQTRPQS